jgi:hypothetical protein
MARDWKQVAWQIHMLWALCCGDMLHWAGDGNELAYGFGEHTQHLEVRHACGSCSKHGVCTIVNVWWSTTCLAACMRTYNGVMQCQLVEHTITKLPSFTICTAL